MALAATLFIPKINMHNLLYVTYVSAAPLLQSLVCSYMCAFLLKVYTVIVKILPVAIMNIDHYTAATKTRRSPGMTKNCDLTDFYIN